jgi:hypothetical protein
MGAHQPKKARDEVREDLDVGARTDQVLSSPVLMPLVGSVRILMTLEGSVVVPTAGTPGLKNRIGMK